MKTLNKPSSTPIVTNNLNNGVLTDNFYSKVSECLSIYTDRVNLISKEVKGGSNVLESTNI